MASNSGLWEAGGMRSVWRRVLAVALFLVCMVIAFVFAHFGPSVVFRGATTDVSAARNVAYVRLTLQSINPSTKTVTASLAVSLDQEVQKSLVYTSSKRPVANCQGATGQCTLPMLAQNEQLDVVLNLYQDSKGGQPTETYDESVPLTELYRPLPPALSNSVVFHSFATVTFPIEGAPQDYPRDSYVDNIGIRLDANDIKVPTTAIVYRADDVPDLSMVVTRRLSEASADDVGVTYDFERPLTAQIFTILVAVAMPWCFIFFALGSARRVDDMSDDFRGFVIAFGAVAFTLLLLRPVIVPPYITVLTFVDYVLGFEVAILAFLPVFLFGKHKRSFTEVGR